MLFNQNLIKPDSADFDAFYNRILQSKSQNQMLGYALARLGIAKMWAFLESKLHAVALTKVHRDLVSMSPV